MSTPRPATYSYKTERPVHQGARRARGSAPPAELREEGQGSMSEDQPTRVQQVHCRGRWRAVKRKLQVLAAELGWPKCMEVAHEDQVVGRVLMAGAKLSRWHKLSKHRRKPADRAAERRHRKALRANLRDPDYVPF